MPTFDSERQSYLVRIVYDGPGFAGKTTNLKQISALLPATKRTELYTPAELKGRTMFFDWMEVKGPPIAKEQVCFQLITVPGQIERNYRRRPLVDMADVVVFVADCSTEQLEDTMRTFARLRGSIKRRREPVPMIVQANKQDTPDALTPDLVRRKLKLDDDVMIIPATSVSGRGVRETLAKAMRIGLEALAKTRVLPLPDVLADADALFDHVLTFEDTPDEGPVDAEELYIAAEDVDVNDAAAQVHLEARSLDALEKKAKKQAEQPADAPPDEQG